MDLREFLDDQWAQQARLHPARLQDFDPDWQAKLSAALIGEAHDYQLACTGGVMGGAIRPREERVTELIDILKYWFCLALYEGMNETEIWHLFEQKTYVIGQRQLAPERSALNKVAFVDLDGVLAQKGSWLPNDEAFARAGGTLKIPAMPGAGEFLCSLRDMDYEIVIVTSRKVKEVARLEHDTYAWLEVKRFPHDRVLFGYDKSAIAKTFLDGPKARIIAVEDSVKHALDYANEGWLSFHFSADHPKTYTDNVIHVQTFDDIIELIATEE